MPTTARWFTMALAAITLMPALAPTASAVIATGGNATNDIGGYRIHMFTNSATAGNFAVTLGGNVEVLVVAGGGGGGSDMGGGGGGGRIAVWHGSMTPNAEAELFGGGIPKQTVITTSYANFTGTSAVNGGTAPSNGTDGTIVFLTIPPPAGTVIMLR